MTLLAPIASLIGAAVTVPTLLLFYFLKLRRRPVRVSSTMLWESTAKDLQVNVPLRWIRFSALLLLQLLILALLLLALGRPAMRTIGARADRVLVLIDASASMSAVDAPEVGPTRLDQAKSVARRLVRSLRTGGAQVQIIAFAAEAKAITGLTDDIGAAERAIASISPTDQPGDLAGALRLAEALSRQDLEEGEESEPTLAVIVSDGSFTEGPPVSISGVSVEYEHVGPAPGAEGANLGIVAVNADRDWQDPATVRIFARVQNSATDPVEVPLALRLNGEVVARQPVRVPGRETDGGQAAAIFEIASREGGALLVNVGRPDALASDDTAGLVLAPAQRPSVVLVEPDDRAPGPDWLLPAVLSELDLGSLRRVSAAVYEEMAGSGGLGGVGLIVFDGVRPAALPASPSISFGAAVPVAGLGVAVEDQPRDTGFVSWQRSHPILRHVSLDGVYIARPMRLSLPTPRAGVRAVELARGRDGPLIALVETNGIRRLVVAFDLAQSNWPAHFGFPVFCADAVDYLTLRGEADAGRKFTTIEPVWVNSQRQEMTLDAPDGRSIVLRRIGGVLTAGIIDRAGVYTSREDGQTVVVNLLDETESGVACAEELTVSGRTVAASGGVQRSREMWPWFVLAAAILLFVEWLVYAWRIRA